MLQRKFKRFKKREKLWLQCLDSIMVAYHYFSSVLTNQSRFPFMFHLSLYIFYACFKNLYQDYIDKYVIAFRRTWFGGLESLVQFQSIKIELKLGLIFGTKIEFKSCSNCLRIKSKTRIDIVGGKKNWNKKTKGYLFNRWF
jgi:hypothetical protein